nr:hypothetical protein [Leptolyngbya sp. 7M]
MPSGTRRTQASRRDTNSRAENSIRLQDCNTTAPVGTIRNLAASSPKTRSASRVVILTFTDTHGTRQLAIKIRLD